MATFKILQTKIWHISLLTSMTNQKHINKIQIHLQFSILMI